MTKLQERMWPKIFFFFFCLIKKKISNICLEMIRWIVPPTVPLFKTAENAFRTKVPGGVAYVEIVFLWFRSLELPPPWYHSSNDSKSCQILFYECFDLSIFDQSITLVYFWLKFTASGMSVGLNWVTIFMTSMTI